MAKKTDKNESEMHIDEKIVKAFLLSHKEFKDAELKKDKAAEALIFEMEKAGLQKLSCLQKNISLCQKDTLLYGDAIVLFDESIKKAKEIERIKNKAEVLKTSKYLYVTDQKKEEA